MLWPAWLLLRPRRIRRTIQEIISEVRVARINGNYVSILPDRAENG